MLIKFFSRLLHPFDSSRERLWREARHTLVPNGTKWYGCELPQQSNIIIEVQDAD